MHAAHLVPELALARVVTAGGPYRPGDDLSLAFTNPTVSRLVAHDAELRAKCVPLERALVPEMISVVITQSAGAYASGDVLTLSFVDPRVARVHRNAERQSDIVANHPSEPKALDFPTAVTPVGSVSQATSAERVSARAFPGERRAAKTKPPDNLSIATIQSNAATEKSRKPPRNGADALPVESLASEQLSDDPAHAQISTREQSSAYFLSEGCVTAQTVADEPTTAAETPLGDGPPAQTFEIGVSPYIDDALASSAIRVGERMTLRDDALGEHDASRDAVTRRPIDRDSSPDDSVATATNRAALADTGPERGTPPRTQLKPNERVTVRLEWKPERLRRFVQVVDKLFTIDRLGWYRHSLAMRLLIPDEIACSDTLANVEAMRHLHALRAAAVESLGKPLLAACMPGFSVSSEWLETLESSREARAIAGLREALLPYAGDAGEPIETPADEALCTSGKITRRELLAENATSVEAFLPLLIPTTAHDATLGARLAQYRSLLVELFAQTARADEPVRLNVMGQPNHSLDDRLWQLVGAAAATFGGFARA